MVLWRAEVFEEVVGPTESETGEGYRERETKQQKQRCQKSKAFLANATLLLPLSSLLMTVDRKGVLLRGSGGSIRRDGGTYEAETGQGYTRKRETKQQKTAVPKSKTFMGNNDCPPLSHCFVFILS